MVVTHWILEVGNTRVKWAAFDASASLSSPPLTVERVALDDFSALERWKTQVGANDLVWVSEVASSIDGRTSALPAECSNLAMHCLCAPM